MPTSVALHVLRGLQQKLFIEYHRFTQHERANPSQPQHVVRLCMSQTKSWCCQGLQSPLSRFILIFFLPVLKTVKNKTNNQPYSEQKVNLIQNLTKPSFNPGGDGSLSLTFHARDFLV